MSEEAIHITQVLRAWAKRRGGWNDHVGYVASDFIERIERERDAQSVFEASYRERLVVLDKRIAELTRERDEARANVEIGRAFYAFMVEKAAQREPTLDGYRELGAKCAQLEQKLDEAQRSRDQYRNDALGCTARIAELEAENAKLRGQQSTSFTDEDECVWERDAARNP